jgi:putative CocE/NonD family hydrolase
MQEPPVKLAIRTGHGAYHFRYENEWPIARTQWTKLYLDLSAPGAEGIAGTLSKTKPAATAKQSYSASGASHAGHASASSTSLAAGGGGGISLVTPPLEQDTEVTGPLAAQLWVSSTTEDMDLFLTVRNIDPAGNDVLEIGQQGQPVPVAKGWLRVSHRELDLELSRPYRPYHKHLRRQWLEPNQIVEVQVEIWPTSMAFKKGHRIRLDIQPRDGIGSAPYMHYHADYNVGENTIYSGGEKESFLLVPIIPAK